MTMERSPEDYVDTIARLLVPVYEIHVRILAKGGSRLKGIRDTAMLHSAIARPFTTFGGVDVYPTDFDKAAAFSTP